MVQVHHHQDSDAIDSVKSDDLALRADLPTCLAREAEGLVTSAQTADHREAVRAFVEKRKPDFRGR